MTSWSRAFRPTRCQRRPWMESPSARSTCTPTARSGARRTFSTTGMPGTCDKDMLIASGKSCDHFLSQLQPEPGLSARVRLLRERRTRACGRRARGQQLRQRRGSARRRGPVQEPVVAILPRLRPNRRQRLLRGPRLHRARRAELLLRIVRCGSREGRRGGRVRLHGCRERLPGRRSDHGDAQRRNQSGVRQCLLALHHEQLGALPGRCGVRLWPVREQFAQSRAHREWMQKVAQRAAAPTMLGRW